MKFLTLLLLIVVFSFGNSSKNTWKYKDWEIRDDTKKWIRALTNGNIVKGHQFGIIKSKENCESDLLSLTISTYEKDAKVLEGKQLKFEFKFDEESVFLNLNVTTINKVNSLISIAMFTNFKINKNFLDLMKKSTSLNVNIIEPKSLKDKFDITSESFSLKGFVANYTKLQEICIQDIGKKNNRVRPSDNLIARYNERKHISENIFKMIKKKYDFSIKRASALRLCDKEDQSSIVRPSRNELYNFIMGEIVKKSKYKDEEFKFSTVAVVHAQVIGYEEGLDLLNEFMKENEKDYCEKIVPMILEEEKDKF